MRLLERTFGVGAYLLKIIQLCYQILTNLGVMTSMLEDITRRLTALQAGQVAMEDHLQKQDAVLAQLLVNTRPPQGAAVVVFSVQTEDEITQGVVIVDIKVTQRFSASVAFFDALG